MSTEVLSQSLANNAKAVFGAGTVFLVIAAPTGALNIVARQIGNSNKNRTFTGVPAGFKFTADGPDDGFDTLEVTNVSGSLQTIQLAIGNDDVTYSNSVTVANTVSTEELPNGTLADNPAVVTTASTTQLFATNAARRSMTVFSDPANPGTVYFRVHAGLNKVAFVQPGTWVKFSGTYAVDYQDAAGGNTLYLSEES